MRFIKNWLLKRRIKQAIKLLAAIDNMMKSMKMPRWRRRQVWRDFIKSEAQRKEVINLFNGEKS